MTLTSKQRAFLNSQAHSLKPIIQIGKNGLTDGLIAQIDESLERHELLKINVLETAGISGKLCAGELAEGLGADVVQVIGAKVTLYRPASDPEKRTIELP